jgi:hypothetical protein
MSHFPELGELCQCLGCQGMRARHAAYEAQLQAQGPLSPPRPVGLIAWLPDASGGPFFGIDREADTMRCPAPDTLLSRVGSWLIRLGRRMGGTD